MYDLTTMQLHQRVAEYHRMRTRIQGADTATAPGAQRRSIRVAVASALLSLAMRLAPSIREQQIV